jgi:hypothetical protein
LSKRILELARTVWDEGQTIRVSSPKTVVDLAIGLSGVSVEMLELTVRGSRTVRTLAADRPPVQFLADAPQRLYGWLRAIKAVPTSPFMVFIDLHHTQDRV